MLNSTTWTVSPCKWVTDRGAEKFQCCWSLTCLAHWIWQIGVSDHPPQELEQQFERERLSLEEQKTLLRQQLEELREELTSKLTAANEEVGHQTWHTFACFMFVSVSKVFGKHKAAIEIYLLSICCRRSPVISKTVVEKGVNDDLESEHPKGDFLTVFWTF